MMEWRKRNGIRQGSEILRNLSHLDHMILIKKLLQDLLVLLR